jgi:hypothetical protein
MVEKFIRQSHMQMNDTNGQKFLLGDQKKNGLPLVEESDAFRLPEGATQQFLLNRNRFLLGGGN